jgi:hypothetical protein
LRYSSHTLDDGLDRALPFPSRSAGQDARPRRWRRWKRRRRPEARSDPAIQRVFAAALPRGGAAARGHGEAGHQRRCRVSSSQHRRTTGTRSTHPSRASSTSAIAWSAPSRPRRGSSCRGLPGRRPLRPVRWGNDGSVLRAFACITRFESPTSIPSSSVEVQTMQASAPRLNSPRRRGAPRAKPSRDERTRPSPALASARRRSASA